MPKRPEKPSWASVKARLDRRSPDSLVSLIADLYRASADNRRFLHARFLGTEVEIATYRKLVEEAIYPDPFSRRPVRIGEAQRLVRQYRQATDDIAGTIELTLTLVEAGTEQAADLGYGDERYFGALERALDAVVKDVNQLEPDALERVVARLRRVAARSAAIGWGYGDYVQDLVARLAPEGA